MSLQRDIPGTNLFVQVCLGCKVSFCLCKRGCILVDRAAD